ncbi:hypothetical protein Hanom_Chr06g00545971 [Helianthus anomalus]
MNHFHKTKSKTMCGSLVSTLHPPICLYHPIFIILYSLSSLHKISINCRF